jgi:hypothetical protein
MYQIAFYLLVITDFFFVFSMGYRAGLLPPRAEDIPSMRHALAAQASRLDQRFAAKTNHASA